MLDKLGDLLWTVSGKREKISLALFLAAAIFAASSFALVSFEDTLDLLVVLIPRFVTVTPFLVSYIWTQIASYMRANYTAHVTQTFPLAVFAFLGAGAKDDTPEQEAELERSVELVVWTTAQS